MTFQKPDTDPMFLQLQNFPILLTVDKTKLRPSAAEPERALPRTMKGFKCQVLPSFTFLPSSALPPHRAARQPQTEPHLSSPRVGVGGVELGVIISLSFRCTFVTGQSESLLCFIICPFHAAFLLSSSRTWAPPLTHVVNVCKYTRVLGEDAMSCCVCMFLIYIDAINIIVPSFSLNLF